MLIELNPGTIVDERYEIVELIGDGGMGAVYKVVELGLERNIALKVLHPTLVGDIENQERFRREGKILSELKHPNILACYRFGLWNGRMPYIAMELLSGKALNVIISESGSLPVERGLSIAIQIAEAMAHAHRLDVIHRDLKPGNIIVNSAEDGLDKIKIVDFGLARLIPDSVQASQHLTQTGSLLGSIHYMSPEQCLGQKADRRSDIYSLGCLLYEALAGEPLFYADSPVGVMHLHAHSTPPPIPSTISKSAPGLNDTLMRMLAKNADDRFQTMDEVQVALALVAAGRGSELPGFSGRQVSGWSKSRKKRVAFTVVPTVVFLALSLVLLRKTEPAMLPRINAHSGHSMPRNIMGLYFRGMSKFPADERVAMLNQWLRKYGATADAKNLAFVESTLAESVMDWDQAAAHRATAVATFERALAAMKKNDPDKGKVLFYLAHTIMCNPILTGRIAGARQFLQRHKNELTAKRQVELLRELALTYRLSGNHLEEEQVRREIYAITRDNPFDAVMLSHCLRLQQEVAEAEKVEPKSFSDMSSSQSLTRPIENHGMAESLLEADPTGKKWQSVQEILRCCERSPTDFDCYYDGASHSALLNLALICAKRNNDAYNYLMDQIDRDFTYPELLLLCADFNATKDSARTSIYREFLKKKIEQFRLPDLKSAVALAYFSLDEDISLRASNSAENMLSLSARPSELMPVIVLFAEALSNHKRYVQAERVLKGALSSSPQRTDAIVVFQLARARAGQGFLLEADKMLSDAMSPATPIHPINFHYFMDAGLVRAEILHKLHQDAQALALLENVKKRFCDSADLEVGRKVFFLDRYATFLDSLHQAKKAQSVREESQYLIPQSCRRPWDRWDLKEHLQYFSGVERWD